jgi:hypothetical protein
MGGLVVDGRGDALVGKEIRAVRTQIRARGHPPPRLRPGGTRRFAGTGRASPAAPGPPRPGRPFPHATQALRVTRQTRPLAGGKWRTVAGYAISSLAFGQAASPPTAATEACTAIAGKVSDPLVSIKAEPLGQTIHPKGAIWP